MTAATYDTAIVGGGIVGAALACALGDAGIRVALLERAPARPLAPAAKTDARVSALTLASRNLLANLDSWAPNALAHAHPIARMRVWEDTAEITFDAADIGQAYLGFIAENAAIVTALHLRLGRLTSVDYYDGIAIEGIEIGDTEVQIRAGETLLSAPLVVGADGADSAVRRAAGIDAPLYGYDQRALVATIATQFSHEQTAWQRFLPSGPLALLPLDAHRYSIVWSLTAARADAVAALDDGDFIAALSEAFGTARTRTDLGGILQVGARAAFTLAAAHATRYVQARVAIVGDAAHRIHPLAGQGLNLGLSDAAALAQVLIDAHRTHRDLGAVRILRRYERWRKGDNLAMLALTDGLHRLFSLQSMPAKFVRRSGLRALDRAAPLKNMLIRYAAGLQGELPQLCREAGYE